MKQYDVAVVGGGLAGLTAACYLARAGKKVALYERSGELGGRARTEVEGDYAFNLGAHALYRGGPAQAALAELDVPVAGHHVGASGSYAIAGGRLHTLPSGPISLLTTGLMPLSGKLELAGVLARLKKEALRIPTERTVGQWLEGAVRDPAAREVLAALMRVATYGADPRFMSAALAVSSVAMAVENGVEYVDGGWRTIVAGLRDRALSFGTELHLRARVARVESGGLILEDGTEVAAGSVIVAVPPRPAAELFEGATRARLEQLDREAVPAVAACLDVALSSLPRPKAGFALGIDRPLYVSVHSRVARLAPEGGALVHTLKYLDPRAEGDAAADERELEGALELLQPGWRDVLVKRRFLPRMVVSSVLVPAQGVRAAARPEVTLPAEDGVYVAGEWVSSTMLLADACFVSAKQAAELVLARAGSEAQAA